MNNSNASLISIEVIDLSVTIRFKFDAALRKLLILFVRYAEDSNTRKSSCCELGWLPAIKTDQSRRRSRMAGVSPIAPLPTGIPTDPQRAVSSATSQRPVDRHQF
jgi:hypothetical protein